MYSVHHVDNDEKEAYQFRKRLSARLQESLVLFHHLTFNALVSATISQEGASCACKNVEEKKMKRAMSGPYGGSSGCAPPKYHLV
jgi:hypothetical protein